MIAWSVNYLFLVNAGLLALLAAFLAWRQRTPSTWIFCAASVALALWSICIYLLEERVLAPWLSGIVRVQLISALLFANGLYYFCSTYPIYRVERGRWVNLALVCVFVLLIAFTGVITEAELVDGEIVYSDGAGYLIYSVYLSLLGISALYRLVSAWRQYPKHRARIRYFFIGVATYVVCAITFNLILPSFGIYDYLMIGRLSATVAPVMFFYAITKHDFLDITVIINRHSAWAGALLLLLMGGVLLYELTLPHPWLNLIAMMVAIAAAGLCAERLQRFLLTTAKRKFVRGWYVTEEVINRLSSRITQEKSREAIFREIGEVLDEVFELEEYLILVAVRDEREQLYHYRPLGDFRRIEANDPLIKLAGSWNTSQRLEESPVELRGRLQALQPGFGHRGMVLPFHSPEYLEGLIVLGERSNQMSYNEQDLRFFDNLLTFLSPILYRLTPMETLEALYFENKQKLHEAEIQLIRAQKIESIVHATRQCHHEIRTPLNIIRLGLGRLKTLEELENFKQVAREEIDHALEIVEETLTIADVNRSGDKQFSEINVNDVIRRCLRLIDTFKYKVVLDLGEVPPIRGYFSDLQVVLTNLIHNAMDAMPGGGSLAFSTRVAGNAVLLSLEDTGEGIDETLKSRVWEPYFSGRATRVGNSTAGRGWGLTIANRIIGEHGGTIRFVSEKGIGTRFTITLPVEQRVMEEKAAEAEAPTAHEGRVVALPRNR